ncbi:hypothetical protein BC941DRAFT_421751 [Chlamydoabsidia padenii]|nr:hypothetical protein BC941DRAFT_421751 [Chlamydoabsidia padenii]
MISEHHQQRFDTTSPYQPSNQVYPSSTINNEEYDDFDLASLTSSISNIDVESIDYRAVYARHVFIATVEGQISVMQDDKLTLLDDTNAYWWLVKIIKTSDVGYIPAESIETPLERLARFNKIRNAQNDDISNIDIIPTRKPISKRKRVSIANTISIQTMIIVTDAYDTPLMESFEESKGEIDYPQKSALPAPTRLSNYSLSRGLAHHFLQHHATPCTRKSFRQLLSKPNRSAVLPAPFSSSKIETAPAETKCLSVLRVFAGNISVKANFYSVLVDESTTAAELLSLALERFRLSQQQQGDGVEYYITVKVLDGDELTLSPQDKPLAMFHSLNTHLTTPMPSLTHIRSKIQLTRIGVTTLNTITTASNSATSSNNDNDLTSFGKNSVIRFLLNKRIKRINEKDGNLRIKIAYYPDSPFSTLSLSSNNSSSPLLDRMEKLVAVSGSLRVIDLTCLALEKFHLQQGGVVYTCGAANGDNYGMTLVRQGKEHLLPGNRTVMNLLKDEWNQQKDDSSVVFVLRKMSTPMDEKHQIEDDDNHSTQKPACNSDLSLTSSSSSSLSLDSPNDTISPHTKITTEDLIQRIDRTLSSLEQCMSVTSGSYKSTFVNTLL